MNVNNMVYGQCFICGRVGITVLHEVLDTEQAALFTLALGNKIGFAFSSGDTLSACGNCIDKILCSDSSLEGILGEDRHKLGKAFTVPNPDPTVPAECWEQIQIQGYEGEWTEDRDFIIPPPIPHDRGNVILAIEKKTGTICVKIPNGAFDRLCVHWVGAKPATVIDGIRAAIWNIDDHLRRQNGWNEGKENPFCGITPFSERIIAQAELKTMKTESLESIIQRIRKLQESGGCSFGPVEKLVFFLNKMNHSIPISEDIVKIILDHEHNFNRWHESKSEFDHFVNYLKASQRKEKVKQQAWLMADNLLITPVNTVEDYSIARLHHRADDIALLGDCVYDEERTEHMVIGRSFHAYRWCHTQGITAKIVNRSPPTLIRRNQRHALRTYYDEMLNRFRVHVESPRDLDRMEILDEEEKNNAVGKDISCIMLLPKGQSSINDNHNGRGTIEKAPVRLSFIKVLFNSVEEKISRTGYRLLLANVEDDLTRFSFIIPQHVLFLDTTGSTTLIQPEAFTDREAILSGCCHETNRNLRIFYEFSVAGILMI